MKTTRFPRATALAHQLVRERLKPGETAVDGTIGNGHDTLFLANLVGKGGKVIGYDVQAEALESAREKVRDFPQVELIHASHERIRDLAETGLRIDAAMFNLGYLPGGDKLVITQPVSTIAALEAALELGARILTVVVYPGHEGGEEEARTVGEWATGLDQEKYSVVRYAFENQRNAPPFLIAIESTGSVL
ncbi:MAG: class I SAM-dependent methyltransferase [Verrucomicrobiales bacterium]|nr:class I SAM-dependent methyltransferase [Verrucomicrobiales bacterium]